MSTASSLSSDNVAWFKTLTPTQWKALLASNLGWLFDGFETYALILTAGVALRQLLDSSLHSQIPSYIGTTIALTLLGWGIGGMLGGILADYIGRKRMMIIAILAYSLAAGVSAFSFDWISFAITRFIVGIAIGSEWTTGSSMIAELWPAKLRGIGASLMQCGYGLGFFLASFLWMFVSSTGADNWRYMYLIGVLPALLTLWIRHGIPESEIWKETNKRRKLATKRKRDGELSEAEEKLTRFTLTNLFTDQNVRGRTLIVFLMSLSTTVGFWGISTWVPPFIGALAAKEGLTAALWVSYAGMAYTFGSVLGYISFGFLADRYGRKPTTILFYALALAMTPVLFLSTEDLRLLLLLACANAFFSCGQYSWMPAWLPELYPTRMRATALAFASNGPRFIAFLGPLLAGAMIIQFGGFGQAAMLLSTIYIIGIVATFFLPETRGEPLPA
ncbi:MFS transporter [Bradyrhizobium sp. KBS0727]|uniref:MFS transporter n=1 Tax=unclassified Bradyrhizobium TaxID=2631580 RepID=UPI00110EF670|nr:MULTISPECIES: MFS transporter [unclassified Bradyrhizobium]QDW40536.1 MFS transporter [Bradyrhizobium sp. KBS0725]QDW47141.1 MFS transporter [Bradyrhizobium sp. KBS0727]